ncbi:hypothetical protein [Methylogaea oryzae]|uniref:Uncharacterized protein n=1 Tax=Methylogaea oryzae TaxID=1295382 RepID=A0A8D4VSD7_9GAMM|nr:hypothetical protein [Methylogaea oryzae]BBL72377.1 hypothetical protein MoryE10_29830 [Methylogaea oryzae]
MRPRAITYLCVLLLSGGAMKLLQGLSLFVFHSDKAALFALVISLAAMVSYAALWFMQRWGVYLFLLVWFVSLFPEFSPVDLPLDAAHNHFHSTFNWVLLAVYLVVVLPYWRRLNGEHAEEADDD